MITYILAIVAGFIFGVLFTRKNNKLVEKAVADAKAAAVKAEIEARKITEKAKTEAQEVIAKIEAEAAAKKSAKKK
jgi:regulator of protease activity HflC (stomatin/prohibitin superfamily)